MVDLLEYPSIVGLPLAPSGGINSSPVSWLASIVLQIVDLANRTACHGELTGSACMQNVALEGGSSCPSFSPTFYSVARTVLVVACQVGRIVLRLQRGKTSAIASTLVGTVGM